MFLIYVDLPTLLLTAPSVTDLFVWSILTSAFISVWPRPLSLSCGYKCGVCQSQPDGTCWTCGADFEYTQWSHTYALEHNHTHSLYRLLKSRCIYVHLRRHINTSKCATDEGAISPLCLNGNHVQVLGWGRISKVSPSTHYVGWPVLPWGTGNVSLRFAHLPFNVAAKPEWLAAK